jgi:hypothetical protein
MLRAQCRRLTVQGSSELAIRAFETSEDCVKGYKLVLGWFLIMIVVGITVGL